MPATNFIREFEHICRSVNGLYCRSTGETDKLKQAIMINRNNEEIPDHLAERYLQHKAEFSTWMGKFTKERQQKEDAVVTSINTNESL